MFIIASGTENLTNTTQARTQANICCQNCDRQYLKDYTFDYKKYVITYTDPEKLATSKNVFLIYRRGC